MYEQVFHFNARPFTSTPYVKHYFAGDSINSALEQARVCINRGSGPAIVVGGTGTGKSLLLAMLEEQYKSQFNVVNLACARLGDRRELLQNVLFELQLPFKDQSETELRFSLLEFLKPGEQCPNGILLLVDEAHTLSTCLLDEICLIMNFVRDGLPRVRLVMAGTQRLEENLGSPKLESLNQRIASRCYLRNMSREETGHYVCEHIDRVGGHGVELFEPESLKAIHEVSEGCPRLVNQVADHALILAATQGRESLNSDSIFEAWSDVQSIPGTYQPAGNQKSPSKNKLTSDENWTVIEFGQLEDDEPTSGDTTAGTVGTIYDFENNEPTTTAFDTEQEEDDSDEYRLSPEEPMAQDDLSPLDSEVVPSLNESSSNPIETSEEASIESIEAVSSFPNESSTETEESFVGWGAHENDETLNPTQTPVEITNQAQSHLPDVVDEASPDTFLTSEEQGECNEENHIEQGIHTEQETSSLAEFTPIAPDNAPDNAPESDLDSVMDQESPTVGNTIEDLEAEQNQIFDQVDQDQQSLGEPEATYQLSDVDDSPIELDAPESDEPINSPTTELVSAELQGVDDEQGVNEEQATAEEQPELLTTWEGYTPQGTEPVEDADSDSAELEQVDDAYPEADKVEEPIGLARQPVDTVDPFAESFAEEEKLLDRYAPFVIHQNQSSLSVTPKHLSMLVPNDAIDPQSDASPTSHDSLEAKPAENTSNPTAEQAPGQDGDANESIAYEFVAQESASTEPEPQDSLNSQVSGIAFSKTTEPHETTGNTPFTPSDCDSTNGDPVGDQPFAEVHENAMTATTDQAPENAASSAEQALSGVTENPTAPTWVETPPPVPFSEPIEADLQQPTETAESGSRDDEHDNSSDHQAASETEHDETDVEPVAAKEVHQHGDDDATSAEIQRQAEAILARLNKSRSENDVSHETTTSTSSERLAEPYQPNAHSTTTTQGPTHGEPSDFERQSAALDQSQQILNEILEQKNALKQSHEVPMSGKQQSDQVEEIGDLDFPAPVDVAMPDSISSNDDKEMIIVNRMEETIEPQTTPEPPIPFPPTPVSTGRAERMDYQKLFDQLRDISNNPG